MSLEKVKTFFETSKIALDIVMSLIDRSEKTKSQEKKIADLEAEVARLKEDR